MATAQMTRDTTTQLPATSTFTNSGSSVVIPDRVATEQQSLAVIKKLLAVSVSCITYLRGMFPEYAYGTRYLEDVCVKILREDKRCPGPSQVVKWLLGCFDALEKKYLRMIVLAVYTNPEDPQTITECYQFKFKYTPSGATMDFTSGKGDSTVSPCSDTKKTSILLIRKLYILMQFLGPLPNDIYLTMKLFYHDEVTPTEYQPPGFKEGSCDGMMFEGDPMHLSVGEVSTPYHVLKVKVTTEKDRMAIVEDTLLKKDEDKTPSCAIQPGTENEEKTDHPASGESASMNWENCDVESMNSEEVNEETEKTKSGQNKDLQANQVFPGSVSEGLKTRSGKVFCNERIQKARSKTIQPASIQKQAAHPTTKRRRPFEIPMSQEESSTPKRRKYSEPKDTY